MQTKTTLRACAGLGGRGIAGLIFCVGMILPPRVCVADDRPAESPARDHAPLVERSDIGELLRTLRDVPEEILLREMVAATSGCAVLEWQGQQLDLLERTAARVVHSINENGVAAARVNEVGQAVEKIVQSELERAGFEAGIPRNTDGNRQSSGYPDLVASRGGDVFYIEVKTYHPRNEDTSQRSFYFSPLGNSKIAGDAYHLLIAFAIVPSKNGRYETTGVKWLDLYGLKCRLKFELNAPNKSLYSSADGLVFFESSALQRDPPAGTEGKNRE